MTVGRSLLGVYAAVVIALAAVAISFEDEGGMPGPIAAAAARFARAVGSGSVLYSLMFFAAAYAAFARNTVAVEVLYLTWIAFFQLAPIERGLAFLANARRPCGAFGIVEQIVDPGFVVVPGRAGVVGRLVGNLDRPHHRVPASS